MGNFFDIIIIGGIAVYLVYRLISTLGKDTGHKRNHQDSFIHQTHNEYRARAEAKKQLKDKNADKDATAGDHTSTDNVVVDAEVRVLKPQKSATQSNPNKSNPKFSVAVKAEPAVKRIGQLMPGFSSEGFLQGASSTFEIVYSNFSDGSIDDVRHLLKAPVYNAFKDQLQHKQDENERWDFELFDLIKAHIVEASVDGSVATICVRFRSKRVEAMYNSDGKAINDTSSEPFKATDQWDFQHDISGSSPAWFVVRTKN